MGMTMTQKILAAHAGLDSVEPGQLILVNLDRVLGNDITSPVAIREFNKLNKDNVFDKDKVTMVMDHFAPNKDIKAATQCKMCRDFCGEKEITHFYDVGQMGIEHALLPEKGLVVSGDVVIGADSHTCTYGALGAFSTGVGSTDMACGMAIGKAWFKVPSAIKFVLKGKLNPYISGKDVILHIIGKIGVDGALYRSMEFTGEGVASLSMSDRLTMTNMAIEAGAKNGIFEVDDQTLAFVAEHSDRKPVVYKADEDAVYDEVIEIDLSEIKSTVAFPHLPGNTRHHRRGGRGQDRPGCHRLLYQRFLQGHRRGSLHHPWQKGGKERPCHHHPGNPVDLSESHGKRSAEGLHRGRLRGLHPDLRPVSGRSYGYPGGRRACGFYHKPELRGQNGSPGI